MGHDNVVFEKGKLFAIRIVNLYNYLCSTKKEYILSKQILRSGTSIGANISEAIVSFSRSEFIYKMNIALKEASETKYWLELLYQTKYLTENEYKSLECDCNELLRMLIAIIKTSNGTDNNL